MIFDSIETCIGNYYKPRLKLFKKLFGDRVIDVLLHMPSHTIEKQYVGCISRNDVGKLITTKLKIESIESNYRSTRPAVIYARNADTIVEIVLFNYPKGYIKNSYIVGQYIGISGRLIISASGALQFINPDKFTISKIDENSGLFNVYPLTTGLTQKSVYSVIKSAFEILEHEPLPEWLPEEIVKKNGFVSFAEALRNIHYPQEIYENPLDNPYRRRLAFDELFAEQLIIRCVNEKTSTGYVIKNDKQLIHRLLEYLPFSLTKSQNKAISEIFLDLESGKPMLRLLQGDVGSGKTIVALISALYVIESGFQCAILAPTEILAQQHYQNTKKYFDQLGIFVEILTGSDKGKKRAQTLANLASGSLNILVGTHAIITEQVCFHELGLVIIDEQHRFGVKQRQQLINKGISPHVLSMSATPIPRTFVMALYGNISVSSITEKPAGRKEIITKAIPMARIPDVVQSIKNIIVKNQKVYWICPLIEENENLSYTCVFNRFEFLSKYFGSNVAMLHGKMKANEKDAILENFKNGICNILISTTVIEVGIDIPEATVIIIENAEKFGLAQLHQLRGRVGRNDLQAYCLLLYDYKASKIATKRIQILCESNDGFKIAEQDLMLRGGGEIYGIRQSGAKTYKTFDIYDPYNQYIISSFINQAVELASHIPILQIETKKHHLLSIFCR